VACDVPKDLTYLLIVLHCVFLVLVPGLFLDKVIGVSASDFSIWPKTKVSCSL